MLTGNARDKRHRPPSNALRWAGAGKSENDVRRGDEVSRKTPHHAVDFAEPEAPPCRQPVRSTSACALIRQFLHSRERRTRTDDSDTLH